MDELAREAGDPPAVDAARPVLARARAEIVAGRDPGDLESRLRQELAAARAPSLRRVLNATGVVVHTNLGRAALAAEALGRCGHEVRYGLSGGAADANVFTERGLSCLNLTHGVYDFHSPDERIAVTDLEALVDVPVALVECARDGAG